jgi:hypothetical protein
MLKSGDYFNFEQMWLNDGASVTNNIYPFKCKIILVKHQLSNSSDLSL